MDYNPRQHRHHGEPKNHPHHLSLQVHRALCWWPSAKSYLKHVDDPFIFLWFAVGADYALRNHIIHRSASWDSHVNRSQVNDGVGLLRKRVPTIIKVMMDNLQAVWGEANYPLVRPLCPSTKRVSPMHNGLRSTRK